MGLTPAQAQLPPVGQMFALTRGFQPPILRGMTVHAENPLLFDFIVDRGQDKMADGPLKGESEKLIKYFLASMTIPDKDAWVNLSPTEKDRIIPDALGQTEMGKTMLEQDYMLKQLAASLTNPDTELGKKYWEKVGTVPALKVTVPTFSMNKVWIVPAGATVVEKDGFAYITESKLDVMMEEDYQNMSSPQSLSGDPLSKMDSRFRGNDKESRNDKESGKDTFNNQEPGTNHQEPATAVFRSLILPKLIKEVNEGKTFAPTRQVYQSVILAAWYKKALKDSLLGKIYADKSKIEGITTDEKDIKQKVYDQYLEAFKKGVYNVIKEEEVGEETIPRKYFSGGEGFYNIASTTTIIHEGTRWRDAELEISALGASSQIVLVAASAAESPNEMRVISQRHYAGMFARLRSLILSISAASLLNFPVDSFSSDWTNSTRGPNQFPTLQLRLGPGENLKSIVEHYVGPRFASDPELLRKTYSILRRDNPGLPIFPTNFQYGRTLNMDRVHDFLRLRAILYSYKTAAISTFGVNHIDYPLFIVVRDAESTGSEKSGRRDFEGLALKDAGAILNIQTVANGLMEVFDIMNSNKPENQLLNKFWRVQYAGTSFAQNLLVTIANDAHHEAAHFAWDPILQKVPVDFIPDIDLFKRIRNSSLYGPVMREVAAIWDEISHDPKPKINIEKLADFVQNGPYKHPSDQRYYEAYQVILYNIYVSSGFRNHLINNIKNQKEKASGKNLTESQLASLSKTIDNQLLRGGYYESFLNYLQSLDNQTLRNIANQAINFAIKDRGITRPSIRTPQIPDTVIESLRLDPKYSKYFSVKIDQKGNIVLTPQNLKKAQTEPQSMNTITNPGPVTSSDTAPPVGGIDFDPSKLNLQIKRDGHGVPLPLPQQDVEHIEIKGLFPVILNIRPVNAQTLPILGQLNSNPAIAISKS